MRRRGHVIPLRLNEREYRHLCEQVKISGLSREEYLRSLILDKEIHPRQRADRFGTEIQPHRDDLGRFEESRFGGRRPCVMNRFAGCRVLLA